MTERMHELASEIIHLQGELDREIESRRKRLGAALTERIGEFELGVVAEHRRLKQSAGQFLVQSSFLTTITAPVIYSLIVPLLLIDIWISLFQAICFRVYGIARVRRADYIIFGRQHLAYLNSIETVNCLFCAYANGLIAYAREIGSRTEQYWCPIKHALRIPDAHLRYFEFLEYGDANGYRARLNDFRDKLRA